MKKSPKRRRISVLPVKVAERRGGIFRLVENWALWINSSAVQDEHADQQSSLPGQKTTYLDLTLVNY
jgi:hypothetical protein